MRYVFKINLNDLEEGGYTNKVNYLIWQYSKDKLSKMKEIYHIIQVNSYS